MNMIVQERECFLLENPQTAQLWIQYIEYVKVCRNFIRAARASDWTLHLYSAGKIINLLTATRHHSCVKSACVYVKIMFTLPGKDPWLHQKFDDEGLCGAQRGDHFWTCLWTVLTKNKFWCKKSKGEGA